MDRLWNRSIPAYINRGTEGEKRDKDYCCADKCRHFLYLQQVGATYYPSLLMFFMNTSKQLLKAVRLRL